MIPVKDTHSHTLTAQSWKSYDPSMKHSLAELGLGISEQGISIRFASMQTILYQPRQMA